MAIILKDKAYVLAESASRKKIERLFEHDLFHEQTCSKCEFKPERPCEQCMGCEGYQGRLKLYSKKKIGGKRYYGLASGNMDDVFACTTETKVVDKRTTKKMISKPSFTGTPYGYQELALEEMLKGENGILKSAPRTGKSLMALMLILKKRGKTLIITHQTDLLDQFYSHFMNQTDCGTQFTDIPDIEKFSGKKIVARCNKLADFVKHDICLCTYQIFLSAGGKKLLKGIKDLFSILIIDEIHRANATCYSKVVNLFSARTKIGLSATPERKDGKEFIIRSILGDIIHETDAVALKPVITLVETKVTCTRNYSLWTYIMRYLEQVKGRDKLIVKHVVHDLKKGRHILIPVLFKSHAESLVKRINKKMGKEIAIAFTGAIPKNKRQEVLGRIRKGTKIRCTVAMRSMLTGLNVPKWSEIIEIMPISNPPNFEQEIDRICTPLKGKPRPIIKFFVDNMDVCRSCFRTCTATFKKKELRYTDKSYKKMIKYLGYQSKKKKMAMDPDGGDSDYQPMRSPKMFNKK